MRVLMLAVNDPAGTGIQFCKAVNRHSPHSCRIATLETRYTHGWETDLHLPDLDEAGVEELGDLLRECDILHFHMTCDERQPFGPYVPADFLAGKEVVHHHHGHHDFRSDPDRFRRKYADLGRTNLLVSTPDLLKLLPEAFWLPNLVPVDEPLFSPLERDHGGPLRVAHSPTRKDLKNTDEFLEAVRILESRGAALEVDLIDDVPNTECLARKRACHVLFDHMQGYYGVSSLEGLSQGLAVIAGLDDWNRREIEAFTGTDDLPWVVARNRDELVRQLSLLAEDRELCAAQGRKGRRFMEERWSDRIVAGRLIDFWNNCR
ncbi:glycosyltransferase [Salidesulfovibrio onnuriiensis]|uniref:glycosyltransferase n=1 Tax=Salidesulfovibrio onnuriiensis TaxID=2583823 RepID=UPI0011CACFDF|nr:glycosyltransferase [Salidesulfovibrio onnuriiensis]